MKTKEVTMASGVTEEELERYVMRENAKLDQQSDRDDGTGADQVS